MMRKPKRGKKKKSTQPSRTPPLRIIDARGKEKKPDGSSALSKRNVFPQKGGKERKKCEYIEFIITSASAQREREKKGEKEEKKTSDSFFRNAYVGQESKRNKKKRKEGTSTGCPPFIPYSLELTFTRRGGGRVQERLELARCAIFEREREKKKRRGQPPGAKDLFG